jgi:hypothetical protein
MTTAYTSLLGLALPVTGELSGTWGDTVNTAITSLLDTAVAGTTSITVDADITLSTTTGASNEARQAIILWNPASGTTTRNITAPAQSKLYTVINASGGTQSIVIRGAGPTTGVTIAKGESAQVAWNGSDFVKVGSSGGAITFTNLTVTGNTILGDAAADTLTVNATSTFAAPVSFQGLVNLPSTGRSAAAALTPTNPAFLYGVASTYTDTASSGTLAPVATFYSLARPTLATSNVTTYTNAATLYIANSPAAGGSATITNPYAVYVAAGANYFGGVTTLVGNVTLSTLTSGRVPYASTAGLLVDSANLLYSGTDLTVYGITVGRGAGAVSTNTAVGASALAVNTTGSRNTAVGYFASLYATGSSNTAIGISALLGASGTSTGNANTAIGDAALTSNSSGSNNTAVGASALNSNTTGTNSTAVGHQAALNMLANTNDAFGSLALRGSATVANNTGTNNAAFGYQALVSNTSGSFNVAFGQFTLLNNTTASNNTAVGHQAGYSNVTGTANAFVGQDAGYTVTTSFNTAVGALALRGNTVTGDRNTAVGRAALYVVTSGSSNTAVGMNAMIANSSGSFNVAIGEAALTANTTASNNTAVGYQAGYSNQTGVYNTFVGTQAGYTSKGDRQAIFGFQAGYNLTTGAGNTFVGSNAGEIVTTGSNNTFVGSASSVGGFCGGAMTTGSRNTILGAYNGNQGGLDIRTSNNNIVLSDGDGNPWGQFRGSEGLWFFNANRAFDSYIINNENAATPYGVSIRFTAIDPNNATSYFQQCYGSSGTNRFTVYSNGGIANYQANNSNLSDRREKTNFSPAKSYLETICAIPVQTFNYIDQNLEEDPGLTLGVVAQDVQAVAPELVMESKWGSKDDPKMRLSIYQTDLQYALMKALQELKADFDAYKATHP